MPKKKGRGKQKIKELSEEKLFNLLRPVYEMMGTEGARGLSEKVLQMVKKIEKKCGERVQIMSVKTILYLDLDRLPAAYKEFNKMIQIRPSNPFVLEQIEPTFKAMNKIHMLLDLWSDFIKQSQKNSLREEQLLRIHHLFGFACDFKGQQQIVKLIIKKREMNAMASPESQLQMKMWDVIALESFLRFQDESEKPIKDRTLTRLGQMMLEKTLKCDEEAAPRGYNEQYFLMLLRFLEMREDWGKIVKVILSKRGKQYSDQGELRGWLLRALSKSKNWEEVIPIAEKALQVTPDDWECITLLGEAYCAKGEEGAKVALSMFRNLAEKHPKARGLVLGELHVASLQKDTAAARLAVVKYFRTFGKKPCWFADVSKYLQQFLAKDLELLGEEISNCFTEVSSDEMKAGRVAKVRWKISNDYFQFYRGVYGDLEKTVDELTATWIRYREEDEKEEMDDDSPSDDLLLLAVYYCTMLWRRDGFQKWIVKACEILKTGLEKSAHNYSLKWMYMRLLCYTGRVTEAFSIYNTQKIASIQTETMSHLLYYDAVRFGDLEVAKKLHSSRSHYDAEMDHTYQMMIKDVYLHGTLEKVVDFAEFFIKGNRSRFLRTINIDQVVRNFVQRPDRRLEPTRNLLWSLTTKLDDANPMVKSTKSLFDNDDHHTLAPQLWERPTARGSPPLLNQSLGLEDFLFTYPPPSSLSYPSHKADSSALTPALIDQLHNAHFDANVLRFNLLNCALDLNTDRTSDMKNFLTKLRAVVAKLESASALNAGWISCTERLTTSVWQDVINAFETHILIVTAVRKSEPDRWEEAILQLNKLVNFITTESKAIESFEHKKTPRYIQERVSFTTISLDTVLVLRLVWKSLKAKQLEGKLSPLFELAWVGLENVQE